MRYIVNLLRALVKAYEPRHRETHQLRTVNIRISVIFYHQTVQSVKIELKPHRHVRSNSALRLVEVHDVANPEGDVVLHGQIQNVLHRGHLYDVRVAVVQPMQRVVQVKQPCLVASEHELEQPVLVFPVHRRRLRSP